MSENKTYQGAIGFPGLLTLLFITLKLCKVIDWSWWWVLSPSLISIGLFIVACVFVYWYVSRR